MSRFRQNFIGDKAFYKSVLAIMVPVVIQNSVANLVNLLDNIMVGQLGTEQMSGVAIANQLYFVYMLCIFGGLSGPGIFAAQFYGAGDMEGLRNTHRIKIWFAFLITALALVVFNVWQTPLISLFLKGDGDPVTAQHMLNYAHDYLMYLMWGMLPMALSFSYGSTFREAGESVLPMKAGIAAVFTNLIGNWLLIFGNLGFPALGVKGAAIATIISRLVELSILVTVAHRSERFSFFHKIYKTMRVPLDLLGRVSMKGTPLLVNEFLWSTGMAAMNQAYSIRGLLVMSAINISSTVGNLFNVFFLGIGNAVAILVGHALGAGNLKKARSDVWKLFFLTFAMCVVIGGVMAAFAGVFPNLYNVDSSVKVMAGVLILIQAFLMPFHAVSHASYFTLRAGGSSLMTFLFDSAYTWLLLIPLALALVHWTQMPIIPLYILTQGTNVLKSLVGVLLVKSGVWQKNIVSDTLSVAAD